MRKAYDIEKINEIIHFGKAVKSFYKMFDDLIKDWNKWTPFAGRKKLNQDAYFACPNIVNLHHWMRKFVLMSRFFDVRRYRVDELVAMCQQMESPKGILTVEDFGKLLKNL